MGNTTQGFYTPDIRVGSYSYNIFQKLYHNYNFSQCVSEYIAKHNINNAKITITIIPLHVKLSSKYQRVMITDCIVGYLYAHTIKIKPFDIAKI